MSRIIPPRRDLILPSRFRQRQGGYVVLDPYRSGGGGPATDPYWANVTVLLHFDGADGSTTIVDEKGSYWAALGTAELDTAEAKFGPSSCLWYGSDFRLVSGGPTSQLNMANDFTVEYWVNQATAGSDIRVHTHFFNSGGDAMGLNIYRHNVTGVLHVDNGVAAATPGTIAIPLNTWTHVAVVRDGGTIRAYVDGVQALANAMQPYPATINACWIGHYKGGFFGFDGHIDEYRVTDICRYPSGTTFTPPAAPFPNS